MVNAQPPAAMAAGNVETSQRITDVVLGALAQAAPELIPAASSGTMNNLTFGGWDSVRKQSFAYYETIAGGMGASAISDGASATHTHMTNSWNTPVEAFEHQYPLRVRSYRIRNGSGGRGRHRGGDGIIREFEFLDARAGHDSRGSPAARTLRALRRTAWRARERTFFCSGSAPSSIPGKVTIRSRARRCAAHRIARRRRLRQAGLTRNPSRPGRRSAVERVAMRQTWRRLTFLHWRYPPGVVQPTPASRSRTGHVRAVTPGSAWFRSRSTISQASRFPRDQRAHLCHWPGRWPRRLVFFTGRGPIAGGDRSSRWISAPYFWARMRVRRSTAYGPLSKPAQMAASSRDDRQSPSSQACHTARMN